MTLEIKNCSRCQKKFNCGSASPTEKCWCFSLPSLEQLKTSETNDCYCSECLKLLIELQKEPDFYYNEVGLMVMTEAYHLKRGYCCQQNCRHCPYGKKPAF